MGTRAVRWALVGVGALLLALTVLAVVVVVPILTHDDRGSSGQAADDWPVDDWPSEVRATGDDGRTRTLAVSAVDPGGEVDLAAVSQGIRVVVTGTGYDAGRGIYVALCRIPDDSAARPGPCLGGVPEEETHAVAGDVEFAPSNWINDDWAWRMFGARPFDDRDTGTFTAYIEVPTPTDEGIDCRLERCGLYTRNDHTASGDRVQDLHLPIAFAG